MKENGKKHYKKQLLQLETRITMDQPNVYPTTKQPVTFTMATPLDSVDSIFHNTFSNSLIIH